MNLSSIGINGFGRIGRCILREILTGDYDTKLIVINATDEIENVLHYIKYDSIYGKLPNGKDAKINEISGEKEIFVGGKTIRIQSARDTKNLNWQGINVVFECTGALKTKESLAGHIENGASLVVLSCPTSDSAIKTIVFGANDDNIASLKAEDNIVSIGSCTTNCFAPIAKALNETVGIVNGFVTTVHSYTNDQNVLDSKHKDLRRSRACGMSIIPTSSGVVKAVNLVLPQLKNKIDGAAVRVPTSAVSMIDFSFVSKKTVSKDDVNNAIKTYVEKPISNSTNSENNNIYPSQVIQYINEPLVSSDFIGDRHSCIFDSLETRVTGDNFVRVVCWYDNEFAFACRMIDAAKAIK